MLMLRPLELVVHWVCKGHCAQVSLGKWTTPPSTKGISCSAGQRMICCSQSKVKVCLEKRLLSRTGQALQYPRDAQRAKLRKSGVHAIGMNPASARRWKNSLMIEG